MTIDTVLLKVASRCNIDCKYCYIYHSPDKGFRRQPARMAVDTIDKIVARLGEYSKFEGTALAVVLHGGEPLLLGARRLARLLQGLRWTLGREATLALQTNGTLLDDELIELFAETRTRVAVSIDGPETLNDRFRIDRRGRSTYARTMAAIHRLSDHPESTGFFSGVLAVVDPRSDPVEVYNFFKDLNVPSVDFLYRDGNHDRLPYGKRSMASSEYGQWMAQLWDIYVADPDPTPIECLDNMFRGLLGGRSTKEGTGESSFGIIIIETDGSITKNDTLKNSYDGADRFIQDWSVHRNPLSEISKSREYRRYVEDQRPSHATCLECPWLAACGAGMVLHRWSEEAGYDNPSVYCGDQKYLCSHMTASLQSFIE